MAFARKASLQAASFNPFFLMEYPTHGETNAQGQA